MPTDFCRLEQGIFTEEDGSVPLTSLSNQLLLIMKFFFLHYGMSYLNDEVNRTEPSPSERVPLLRSWSTFKQVKPRWKKTESKQFYFVEIIRTCELTLR